MLSWRNIKKMLSIVPDKRGCSDVEIRKTSNFFNGKKCLRCSYDFSVGKKSTVRCMQNLQNRMRL